MVTRHDIERWFPDEDIIAVPESALPAGLTNQPARSFLSKVGLPESLLDVVEFDPQIAKRVRPVADVYRSHGEERPSGTDNLFYLGFAGQPFVCVHGDSGSVVQVHRDFGVRLLASSVGGFVSTLGLVRGEIGEGADPFPARLREAAMKHLREVDPDAVPGAGPAWAGLIDDIEAQIADETRTRVDR